MVELARLRYLIAMSRVDTLDNLQIRGIVLLEAIFLVWLRDRPYPAYIYLPASSRWSPYHFIPHISSFLQAGLKFLY